MARNFKQQFIKYNRSGKKLKAIGVAIHETATPDADAQDEFNYFNTGKRGASVHGFIDWKEDVQTIPWDEKSWHAKEPANSMFISLEMCRPSNNDKHRLYKMNQTYVATVQATARIFKWILKLDKVTKDNVMSHDEIRLKWKNTTHTDPTSYLKELGLTMNDMRRDIQNELDRLNGRVK